MSALKAFKTAGLLMLLAASTTVFGQQKPSNQNQQKPKVKTEIKGDTVKFENMPILNKDRKKIGEKDSTYMMQQKSVQRYNEQKTGGTKTPVQQPKTTLKVVEKEVPNPKRLEDEKKAREQYKLLTPEQKKEQDLNWMLNKKARDAYNKRVPATITKKDTVIVPVETPVQQIDTESTNIHEQDSLNKAERIIVRETLFAELPPEHRPWRVSFGPVWDAPNGPIRDPNAPALGPVSTIYDVDPGTEQGLFVEIASPQLGKKKNVGSYFSIFARAEIYKNHEIPFLIEDELRDGSLYDATVSSSKLRNNLKVGTKAGPLLGNGALKIRPYLGFGLQLMEQADVKVKGYTLGNSQYNALKNTTSAFYEAALDIYLDVGHKKKKNNGLMFVAQAAYIGDTQKPILHSPNGNGTALYGRTSSFNASVGGIWRFGKN